MKLNISSDFSVVKHLTKTDVKIMTRLQIFDDCIQFYYQKDFQQSVENLPKIKVNDNGSQGSFFFVPEDSS